MPTKNNSSASVNQRTGGLAPRWLRRLTKALAWTCGLLLALCLCAALAGVMALAIAYPSLPDVSDLSNYRPKLPLRVFTSEGALIGEFGDERRTLTPIQDIPQVMKNAVLATEDARFYEHGGIDYLGVVRAALVNLLRHDKTQGASTITMQVARNVYLSSERTYTRKIYEMLLTFKLEHQLSKDQILEIYMNQIFLGNRAYGFAAAAETYFGKPLKDITIAEAAMLAEIPKFPSSANPIANFTRARQRQLYIIDRMRENGFITAAQAAAAKQQQLHLRPSNETTKVHAEYVAEMVRQMMFAQYGDQTYSRGLNVYTSINATDQTAAYHALRRGILDFERRQPFRGPEDFIDLPSDPQERDEAIDDALADRPSFGDLLPVVVLQASAQKVVAARLGGQQIELTGDGLKAIQSGLSPRAGAAIKLRPGAVIRVTPSARGDDWQAVQLPEVNGALVALDPRNGALKALIGGFDFDANKFNHITQAWRQPGSGFKPFIYSAALEKGFSPATIVDDGPLYFDSSVTGGAPWEPKDFESTFEGPMPLRIGLAKSKNLVAIRVLQAITPQYAQDWIARFGFDPQRHPAYLTMALGAGSVTPMQMACAFAVFANGGYRVNPYLITRVTDSSGKILVDSAPADPAQAGPAITARNAFIMDTLLNDVTRIGTAARAQAMLKRPDVYGKTGTTNDAMDAWFTGFQPTLVASVWMGYDTPRTLGAHAQGAALSLPVWISFMQTALNGVPVASLKPPQGVARVGSDWYYDENANGGGITNLDGAGLDSAGFDATPPPLYGNAPASPPATERNRILDMFKN